MILCGLLLTPLFGQTAPIAYVLNQKGDNQVLAVIDPVTGIFSETIPLAEKVAEIRLTPDASRLILIGASGSVRLIDTATQTVVADVPLMSTYSTDRAEFYRITPDSRHLVVCEPVNSEIISISLTDGAVFKRIRQSLPSDGFELTPDGNTAIIYTEPRRNEAAEIRFFDIAGQRLIATVPIATACQRPVYAPDFGIIYLAEQHPKPDAAAKTSGTPTTDRIHVVSAHLFSLAAVIDLGFKLSRTFLDPETGQLFVFGNTTETNPLKGTQGGLAIIRGTEIVSTINIDTDPSWINLSPDRRYLYLFNSNSIQVIDCQEYRLLGRIPLPAVDPPAPNRELNGMIISADNRRGFLAYQNPAQLLTLDLLQKKSLELATIGKERVSALDVLDAVTSIGVASLMVSDIANRRWNPSGNRYYIPPASSRFSPKPAFTFQALRSDGRFLFAGNTVTQDITVIDTESGSAVEYIRAPLTALGFTALPGDLLGLIKEKGMILFDMNSRKKQAVAALTGIINQLSISGDKKSVYCLYAGGMARIRLPDGMPAWENRQLKNPVDFIDPSLAVTETGHFPPLPLTEPVPAEMLRQALQSDLIRIREEAVVRIGKLEAARAIPLLTQALADPSVYVRKRAIMTLADFSNEQVRSLLTNALEDKTLYIRAAAAAILESKGMTDMDPKLSLRCKIIQAHWAEIDSGHPRLLPTLVEFLKGSDPLLGGQAAQALEELGDAAVDPLIGCLEDPKSFTRLQAVQALGRLHNPRSLGPLIARIEDPDIAIREEAAVALAEVGQAAIEPMIIAMQSRKAATNYYLSRALKAITNTAIGADPKSWQKWWEKNRDDFTAQKKQESKTD